MTQKALERKPITKYIMAKLTASIKGFLDTSIDKATNMIAGIDANHDIEKATTLAGKGIQPTEMGPADVDIKQSATDIKDRTSRNPRTAAYYLFSGATALAPGIVIGLFSLS